MFSALVLSELRDIVVASLLSLDELVELDLTLTRGILHQIIGQVVGNSEDDVKSHPIELGQNHRNSLIALLLLDQLPLSVYLNNKNVFFTVLPKLRVLIIPHIIRLLDMNRLISEYAEWVEHELNIFDDPHHCVLETMFNHVHLSLRYVMFYPALFIPLNVEFMKRHLHAMVVIPNDVYKALYNMDVDVGECLLTQLDSDVNRNNLRHNLKCRDLQVNVNHADFSRQYYGKMYWRVMEIANRLGLPY